MPKPLFDCQTCGACCNTEVRLERGDRVPRVLVAPGGRMASLFTPAGHPTGYRCAALRGDVGTCVSCSIYQDRPAICRRVHVGDTMCLSARALFNLPGGQMDPQFLTDAISSLIRRK